MSEGRKMMIGIIGAMEQEVTEILKLMDLKEQKQYLDYTFYEGTLANQPVVLLQGGIGKVNAAISATLLFSHYDIQFVMNIGSAGGLLPKQQNVGDVVISSHVVHHDVDVTAFQRKLGEVPGMPCYFEADHSLLTKVENILRQQNIPSHVGLIASGDQFISLDSQVETIRKHFPEAMCAEMEAAAIAQVCYVFKKPFIITRSLSDVFQKGENSIQFDEYLKKASYASAQMCYALISSL